MQANDFGFTTLSAEDYAAQQAALSQTLKDTASSEEVTSLMHQVMALSQMIQAIDDKIDAIKPEQISDNPDLVPRERLVKMSELILPLLRNLVATAKDEYIRWPNRGPICQAQINAIEALLKQ